MITIHEANSLPMMILVKTPIKTTTVWKASVHITLLKPPMVVYKVPIDPNNAMETHRGRSAQA